MSKTKYKIKFTKNGTDDFDPNKQDPVEICVRITAANKTSVCVEFQLVSGRRTTFLKLFEAWKNDEACLKSFNDRNYEVAAE